AMSTVLMIDPVKSIAADSALKPLVRAWVDRSRGRKSVVECGVKDRALPNLASKFFDDLDAFEFPAIVQRRRGRHAGDNAFDLRGDFGGLSELATAVNDAVS